MDQDYWRQREQAERALAARAPSPAARAAHEAMADAYRSRIKDDSPSGEPVPRS